jgi:hypothetical protein
MVVNLVQNAFFKAILPGFDRELQQGNVQVARRNPNTTDAPAGEKTAPQQQPDTAQNTKGTEATATR